MAIVLQEPKYKAIVEKLKKKRFEVGLTQVQVAERLGVFQEDISRIETLQTQLDILMLLKLCDLYKCKINEVL